MKCLVTGGAGFIGSHLCERLLGQNHEVICIDNERTGKKSNIFHLLSKKGFSYIHGDIVTIDIDPLHPQYIFHFASPASPRWYQRYPIETLLVNTYGTYKLLELSRKEKSIVIFASTSEVYGDPLEHPQKESYWGNVNPNGPRSCYDEAKRCGEAYMMAYVRAHKIDGRIVRIFNTYGPRMDQNDGRVVSNFIYQAISNKPITIHGDGNQTRSFCYVSDLVDGIVTMAFTPRLSGEVINLGNDKEITVKALADTICRLVGKKLQYIFLRLPIDDPTKRRPQLEKAKKLLHWKPTVSLEEGLKKTIAYFQKKERV